MYFHSKLLIDTYDYPLPESRIARYPLEQRDSSKLLVYNQQQITEDIFQHVGLYLPAGTLLVSNNTRVVNARLKFKKASGSTIEIFCIEPREPLDYEQMFSSKGHCTWKCMIGNLKRWKDGAVEKKIAQNSRQLHIQAEKAGIEDDLILVHFSWDPPELSFGEVLEMTGTTPIPPYLNRESENIDKDRYQTVYALHDGSVAAPTAGLHFTETLLAQLESEGIKKASITLHVGAGTFRPVVSKSPSDHIMHTEHFSISIETIETLARHEGTVIATGTTTVRTLERV
jgi:S-adenosylmethionine:tRNA ribosyltransferase-isomerase